MESNHGGAYGNHEAQQDKQYQKFFAALNFPVTKETDAWKEKVSFYFLLQTFTLLFHYL